MKRCVDAFFAVIGAGLAAWCLFGMRSTDDTALVTATRAGLVLTDVRGHLPDLRFALTDHHGQPANESHWRGKVTMVLFGYTHCPDICPTTLAKLTHVVRELGPRADDVRILFISVDPARDTPETLHRYVQAFDAEHAIGLSGPEPEIEALAKRYRVAYAAERRDANGHYEVTHSGAVYVFDDRGRARFIASIDTPESAFVDTLPTLLPSPRAACDAPRQSISTS